MEAFPMMMVAKGSISFTTVTTLQNDMLSRYYYIDEQKLDVCFVTLLCCIAL